MQLPISVWTAMFLDLSPEDAVKELMAVGLTHGELSIEHGTMLLERGDPEKTGAAFRSFAEGRGFSLPQGHLLGKMDLCKAEDVDMLKRWLDLFCAVGVRAAVIHATGANKESRERQLELRARSLETLERHVQGTDLTICVENLCSNEMVRTADNINTLIEAAGGGAHLGICLDIGHLHRACAQGLCEEDARDFIRKAGARLKALHVHDNQGVTDNHMMPFVKRGLDWKLFMQALRESQYCGLFNMELHGEVFAPLAVRRLKADYARRLAECLLSEEFIK